MRSEKKCIKSQGFDTVTGTMSVILQREVNTGRLGWDWAKNVSTFQDTVLHAKSEAPWPWLWQKLQLLQVPAQGSLRAAGHAWGNSPTPVQEQWWGFCKYDKNYKGRLTAINKGLIATTDLGVRKPLGKVGHSSTFLSQMRNLDKGKNNHWTLNLHPVYMQQNLAKGTLKMRDNSNLYLPLQSFHPILTLWMQLDSFT